MTNKREEYLDDFVLQNGRKNSAVELLKKLTKAIEANLSRYEDFSLYLWEDNNESEIVLEIYGVRDETEKEYKERIFEEEKRKELDREIAEEEEKKRRLQRFTLYQELKKEFESETS